MWYYGKLVCVFLIFRNKVFLNNPNGRYGRCGRYGSSRAGAITTCCTSYFIALSIIRTAEKGPWVMNIWMDSLAGSIMTCRTSYVIALSIIRTAEQSPRGMNIWMDSLAGSIMNFCILLEGLRGPLMISFIFYWTVYQSRRVLWYVSHTVFDSIGAQRCFYSYTWDSLIGRIALNSRSSTVSSGR